jgi:hypothetical protein
MFDSNKLLFTMPKTPTYKAIWAPIYFEPIIGSGEKLTIAVVAVSEGGEFKIRQSIRQCVVKAMYGNKSDQFNALIELIISSLTSHLSKTKILENWNVPMQGVVLGKIKSTSSSDIIGVLRQAVMLTSSLSSLDFYANDEENNQYSSDNTWSKLLKDITINNHPSFDRYFDREFKVVSEARAAKIFFLSDRSAINTERLRPNNIGTDLDKNKARLLDLFAIKDHDNLFTRSTHELIVYRPTEDDITFSKRQMKRLNDALLTLEEVGDRHSITVTPVNTPQQALKRIERAELNLIA